MILLLLACAAGDPKAPSAADTAAERCPAQTCGDRCVDLSTDPLNCGECGRTCLIPDAEATCLAGECAIASCAAGAIDCDGSIENGCETTDTCVPAAACATPCGGLGVTDCTNPCTPTCLTQAETCNAQDDDCDGTCDAGLGCRQGVYRSVGTHGHLYGLDPAEPANAGQSIEYNPFFQVYAAAANGLSPLYRCDLGGGSYFLTLSSTCEIGAPVDLIIGYVGATAVCDSVPLYRLYSSASGDHFYTTDAGERDAAISVYGYQSEGIAAYVWLTP